MLFATYVYIYVCEGLIIQLAPTFGTCHLYVSANNTDPVWDQPSTYQWKANDPSSSKCALGGVCWCQ